MSTVDHVLEHRACRDCWTERTPDTDPPGECLNALFPNAERCCFCGKYTSDALVFCQPANEVPRHARDGAWLDAAGMKPGEVVNDPRVVTPQ